MKKSSALCMLVGILILSCTANDDQADDKNIDDNDNNSISSVDGDTDTDTDSDTDNDTDSDTDIDTDTDGDGDSVSDFVSSDCKGSGSNNVAHSLLTEVDSQGYSNLGCVSYQVSGDEAVKIDLINYPDSCGAHEGRIKQNEPGSLMVEIKLSVCKISKCSCQYDFSFRAEGVDTKRNLELTVEDFSCRDQKVDCTQRVSLPLGEQNSGIACEYFSDGENGRLHHRCLPDRQKGESLSCRKDFVCTDVGVDYESYVCLAPCETDEDCPLDGALACEGGLCHISNPIVRTCVD